MPVVRPLAQLEGGARTRGEAQPGNGPPARRSLAAHRTAKPPQSTQSCLIDGSRTYGGEADAELSNRRESHIWRRSR
jgi:hypothetical protein